MKLAEWRNSKGRTQDDVAAELGVHRITVARWEQNMRDPGKADLKRIFMMTGGDVTPNDFHDLPLWRRLLAAAMASLRSEAA